MTQGLHRNMSEQCAQTTAVINFSDSTHIVNNATDCGEAGRSANPLFILIYSLLFLVGLILNSFTMWFHCCQPYRNGSKSLMIYLKNLTAADFLLCLILPLRIIHYATSSVYIHLLYCIFGASILILNMYASIFFMGYIALNRYFKVVGPFGNSFLLTTRAAYIISTTTWVFLLAPMATYITALLSTHKPVKSADQNCEELHSEPVKLIYKTIHICAFPSFLLVLLSMLVSYFTTYCKVLQAQRRQPHSSSSKKLLRSRRKMLVLVSIFCICFVPYHIVRLLYVFLQGQCSLIQPLYYFIEFTTVVTVLNVCLDPLVYFIFCKDFRVHLRLSIWSFRVKSKGVNEARRSSEEPLRTININKEVSFSTTSRSAGEL